MKQTSKSPEANKRKKPAVGYGGLSFVFAMAGIIVGFLGGLAFGYSTALVGAAMGAMAVLLGIMTRVTVGRGGMFGLVAGVLAVFLSLASMLFINLVRDGVKEYSQQAPTLASYADELNGGFMGLIEQLDEDGLDDEVISAEIEALQKAMEVQEEEG